VVLLEALSYGNAVLVSDIPENIEVIQDEDILRGFTFRSGQVESLKSILCDLLSNPGKVEDMKKKGRDLIVRKYDWDIITDKTAELYKKLITRNL